MIISFTAAFNVSITAYDNWAEHDSFKNSDASFLLLAIPFMQLMLWKNNSHYSSSTAWTL